MCRWLQALVAAEIGNRDEALSLFAEADELTRIFIASGKTAARNLAALNPPGRQSAGSNRR